MKLHEYWRVQYAENRYLRHLNEEELLQRGRDTLNNPLTLTSDSKIGLLDMKEFGPEAMERFTHFLEECRLRGWVFLETARKLRLKETMPDYASELGRRATKAITSSETCSQAKLFKFGKTKYLQQMFHDGALRVQAASSFRDPKHNNAAGDDEITRNLKLAISGAEISRLLAERGISHEPLERDEIEIHVSYFTDYWVTCFAKTLSPRLSIDFEADALLAIHDMQSFYHRLKRGFRAAQPSSTMGHGAVRYFDPYMPNCNFEAIPLIKPFKYYYQQEYRFFWTPNQPAKRLHFVDINVGNLSDLAEIITW